MRHISNTFVFSDKLWQNTDTKYQIKNVVRITIKNKKQLHLFIFLAKSSCMSFEFH